MAPSYSLDGRLGNIIARGARLKGDVAEAVTSATVSLSTAEVTQLDLTLVDDGSFTLLKSGIFAPGSPSKAGSRLDYGSLDLEVRAVEVYARGADHGLKVTARSVGACKLRRERGPLIRRDLSPTDFARLEAKGAGLRFVGQPSAHRKAIARQVGKDAESSWETLQRLATEVGYLCFEAGGVLYFGKPTWLVQQTRELRVTWKGRRTDDAIDALPTCRRSGDDKKAAATIEAQLRGNLGEDALPGMALILDGVPTFDGRYMVDTVTVPLAEGSPATVSASTPDNPVPQPPPKPPKRTAGGSGAVSAPHVGRLKVKRVTASAEQLGHATTIYRVGADMGIPRRGRVVAIATAIQESVLRNLNSGDRDSLGLFQQRPSQGWGTPAQVTTPTYAARKFYEALRRVSGWESKSIAEAAQAVQRSAFPSAYAQWAGEAEAIVDAIEATRAPATPSAGPGAPSGGATGSRSAAAFVGFALAQAGDRYIYGAEAAASNPNPNAFDCSELVQWAAARAGVKFTDGSSAQIAACRSITVAQAIKTRGALLWHPGHIAISLGNGRTIEAANSRVGVVSYSAAGRFQRGGLIPGMRY